LSTDASYATEICHDDSWFEPVNVLMLAIIVSPLYRGPWGMVMYPPTTAKAAGVGRVGAVTNKNPTPADEATGTPA
jgi:hypothetical protein